ncbi:MAG: hypothetical protein OEQ90_10875 [Gammaproteobacteria bacterium]|nr:hypothetical protein [Gammaproteobacteria bacterium]
MTISTYRCSILMALFALLMAACGGSSSSSSPPPAPTPVADIDVSGNVFDGPVIGGTLFVFTAGDVNAALEAAAGSEDRAAALGGASPLVQLARDEADADGYAVAVSGDLAGRALFLIFDSEGAEDVEFGDQPFNLEAVTIAGDAGSTLRLNITPHTTITSMQVRNALNPERDGTVIDNAAIQTELDVGLANAKAAFGSASLGGDLFPGGEDPHSTTDLELLATASSDLGLAVRTAAGFAGLSMDEVMHLFAADVADGVLDGSAPVSFDLSAEEADDLMSVADAYELGRVRVSDVEAVSCASSSNALRRACEFEVLDEFFIGAATCAHSASEDEADVCLEEYSDDRDEALEECVDVTEARLDLCFATDDAVHNPPFGEDFAANFIDPLTIGDTAPPHPYLPLVQGSTWVYEGTFVEDGEEITEVTTVTVTDRIKFIEGIRCLVVRDVVEVDGQLIEDTDDWFAQDLDGNLWYCGEEAKDYETYDEDMPVIPELVAIDGSFKAGRDGDEAGILLPADAVPGDVYRQEVSFANAEDAIEILATNGTESVPAASCSGDCLITLDFSPLDPGVEEHKYYAPGIGMILEVDQETGDRVELISYTVAP